MNNQEISRGLKLLAEGFTVLSQAFSEKVVTITGVDLAKGEDRVVETVVNTKTNEVVSQKEVKKEEPKKEFAPTKKEESPKEEGILTREDLNALSYNEVKALAKEKGVKAVGSKSTIIDNILAVTGEVEDEQPEPQDEVIENEDVADETEDEVADEEVEEEDLNESNLYETVAKDLEDYSDEELADILSDVGLSPKGKRQALVAKIVQAIEDGLIEWSDEESEESEESADEEVKKEETKKEINTDYVDDNGEYDFVTEARKSACMELEKSIRKDFKAKKLSHKDIIKFLKGIDEEFVSGGAESDLEDYIYIQFNLVDEDGTLHEMSDPYYIGESVCCCGQELSQLEEDEFVCEICGESYTM